MSKSPYGSTIVDGRLRYTSASSLTTFDPNSYGGCNRKWWFEKVLKLKQEQTAAQKRGTKSLHEPIEAYYATGVEAFTPLVMSGRRYLYPRASMYAELEIGVPLGSPAPTEDNPMTDEQLLLAPVTAGDVPVVGRLDLMQALGTYIDEQGNMRPEPHQATVEVNDWKSTKAREYAKTSQQLRELIQMLTYGRYVRKSEPRAEHIRLSHTYFQTEGKADAWKATVLVPVEEIARRWEYVDGLGREMTDVAREQNPEKVEPQRKSCTAYGRNGCPFKSPGANGSPPVCSAGRFNSLSSVFGEAGAKHLLAQLDTPTEKVIPIMSILQKVNPAAAAAPALTLPTVTPQNTPQHVGVNLTLGSTPAPNMLAALEAEEAATTTGGVALTQAHADAFAIVDVAEMGTPTFGGRVAAMRRAFGAAFSPPRTYPPGDEIKGSGRLAGLATIDDPDKLLALAVDLKAHLASKVPAKVAPTPTPAPIAAPTMPAMLPPEAPPSNPALAALPVEGMAPPVAAAPITLPPAPTPEPTPAPSESPVAAAPPKAEPAKGKRKTKTTDDAPRPSGDPNGQPFELYVNCIPSKSYESLDTHVTNIAATIVGFFKAENDIPDVRTLSDQRAGFGKWKGLLSALTREAMTDGKIPRGTYVVFTRGNEIAEEVANGMISARTAEGDAVLDLYVRGI